MKGGDPFVFGRGGEELDIPAEKGIPFEVVPGVTSAVAALSEAGIPVTARGIASSFHVVTGHQKGNEPLQIPFDALVQAGGTLVFLMGMGALPKLAEGLISAGMDPETPAAAVENGARPEQRELLSTLARLPEEAAAMGLHSPAVIAVGAVCGLSGRYDWREKLPLHGQKVIAGRSGSAGGKLLRLLERTGLAVYDLPRIRTDPLPGPVPPEILDSRWLTFSSKTGVRCFFDRLLESGLDTRVLSGIKIAAVGRATAAALREKGILPDLVPEQFDGEHLGKALAQRTEPVDLITLCEPESPSGTLREILTAAGRTVASPPALPYGAAAAAGAGTGGTDAAGRGAGRFFQRLDGPVAGGVAAGDGLFRRHRLLHRPGDRKSRPGGGVPDGRGGRGDAERAGGENPGRCCGGRRAADMY